MKLLVIFITSFLFLPLVSTAQEIYGKLELQSLLFLESPESKFQKQQYFSIMLEPEFRHYFNDNLELKTKLFHRHDTYSGSRTHSDIRELTLNYYEDDWELNVGIGKVFWGTTESRHLVDIVNQVDLIESLDREARLGQPMFEVKLIKDWGQLEFLVLPYFRTLDFNTQEARPKINANILENQAIYQDSARQKKVDIAMRWSKSYDNLDIGLSGFSGTNRSPLFKLEFVNEQLNLIPVYVQTKQIGLDSQYIWNDLLLKVELLARQSHDINFKQNKSFAFVSGGEYTFVGLFTSSMDLGLIAEYMYDDLKKTTPFQNDFMTGLRLVFNNESSTEILLGNIYDLGDTSQVWRLETSSRLTDNFKLNLLARWMTSLDRNNQFYQYKNDNLVSIKISYYF